MSDVIGLALREDRLDGVAVRRGFRGTQVLASFSLPIAEQVDVALRAKLRELGVRARRVHVGLTRRRAVVKVIELPAVAGADVRRMIGFELERHLPFPAAEALFDFHVLDGVPGRPVRALLVAVERRVFDRVHQLLRDAGLVPRLVDVSIHSLAALVGGGGDRGEGRVVVHVEEGDAELAVVRGGRPLLSRAFPLPPNGKERDARAGGGAAAQPREPPAGGPRGGRRRDRHRHRGAPGHGLGRAAASHRGPGARRGDRHPPRSAVPPRAGRRAPPAELRDAADQPDAGGGPAPTVPLARRRDRGAGRRRPAPGAGGAGRDHAARRAPARPARRGAGQAGPARARGRGGVAGRRARPPRGGDAPELRGPESAGARAAPRADRDPAPGRLAHQRHGGPQGHRAGGLRQQRLAAHPPAGDLAGLRPGGVHVARDQGPRPRAVPPEGGLGAGAGGRRPVPRRRRRAAPRGPRGGAQPPAGPGRTVPRR